MGKDTNGMLSQYRVLDLTDEKGWLCGKMLGDLGADVIKVEPPGGDPSRNIGPFYHDEPDPEKSLLWFAFNTSKRGITLDIEKADGKEIFEKLLKTADIVVESFSPGYMDKLGLGYTVLEKLKPGVIIVSITPFGQTGPYKDYKTSDIVVWAMGGRMYGSGDIDRRPVRVSHHSHAYLHAAGEAAKGAMMALYSREMTGEGRYVDVSIQEAVAQTTYFQTPAWDMVKINLRPGRENAATARGLAPPSSGPRPQMPRRFPTKDGGFVTFSFWSGPATVPRNRLFVAWLDSEGFANDYMKNLDWDNYDAQNPTQEQVDGLQGSLYKFFASHTKAELKAGAIKRGARIYAVSDINDLIDDPQLAARKFWVEVEHPELGSTITYPGPFARLSESSCKISRRAPLIGEHNLEVYERELGISRKELVILKQAGVI